MTIDSVLLADLGMPKPVLKLTAPFSLVEELPLPLLVIKPQVRMKLVI